MHLLCDILQAQCSWSCGREKTLSWPMSGMWSSLKRMNQTDPPSLEPNTKRYGGKGLEWTAMDLEYMFSVLGEVHFNTLYFKS